MSSVPCSTDGTAIDGLCRISVNEFSLEIGADHADQSGSGVDAEANVGSAPEDVDESLIGLLPDDLADLLEDA